MKLTYWIAERLDDGRAYSIRATRKEEVVTNLAAAGAEWDGSVFSIGEGYVSYAPIKKVTVIYRNAFDLVCQTLGEGGLE